MFSKINTLVASVANALQFKAWTRAEKKASQLQSFDSMSSGGFGYGSVSFGEADFEKIMHDDEILNCWQKRMRAVLAREYRLEGDNEEQIGVIEKSLENIMTEFIKNAMLSVAYGFSAQEVTTTIDNGYIVAKETLKIQNMRFMWVNINTPQRYLQAQLQRGSIDAASNLNIYTHFYQRDYQNPMGYGIARDLQGLQCARETNNADMLAWSKRYSQGFIIAKANQSGEVVAIDDGSGGKKEITRGKGLFDNVRRAAGGACVVIDKEDEVNIWQPTGTSSEFYLNNDARLRKQIQKMILGESKTSGDDKGGSFASDKVANDVREEVTDSDINFVRSYIQELINRMSDANGFNAPTIIFEHDAETNETKAAYIKTLSDAGAKITQKGLSDLMGFSEEQFTIASDTVAPAPTPTPKTALRMQANLAQNSRFTPAQQRVEAIADDAIGEFIDNKAEIMQAITLKDSKEGVIDAINALDAPDFSKIEEFIKKAIKQGADDVDGGAV